MRIARLARLARPAAVCALLTSCGLGSSGFEQYTGDDVMFAIADTTTTSTTTTTTTTVPLVPSSLPGGTTIPTTTTTTPIQTQPIELYWVVASSERLQLQVVPLSEPTEQLLIFRLEQGPPAGEASVGLDTKVREGLVLEVIVSRGIATVDLSGDVIDAMPRADPRLAIAQIVLTLTRFQGIGQVLFTRDGGPFGPPLPPNDELAPIGEPVAYEDFAILLVQGAGATTTTRPPPVTDPPVETEPPVETGPP